MALQTSLEASTIRDSDGYRDGSVYVQGQGLGYGLEYGFW